jgi:putative aminopeptidase FrvX
MATRMPRPPFIPASSGVEMITMLAPPVRYAGAFVESVRGADVMSLVREVVAASGQSGTPAGSHPPAIPLLPVPSLTSTPRSDSLADVQGTLASIIDLPAVPGHEWRVRETIRASLPEWARRIATVDSVGNLIVAMGPDRDTSVFIAHMDEVSFEVVGWSADGVVSLARRGGVGASAWEGQPAMLHFDPASDGAVVAPPPSLRGVFIPRDSARVKAPPQTMTAWFGLDSAGLVAAGVKVGLGVTGWKAATPIGPVRFTGRSLDDRAGSTALLVAIRHLDPTRLTRKALFVWSVREEGGLQGARAVAARLAGTVKHVYAIDTFVSSDTPLERPTFAYAPLGSGAVLRSLDDGEIVSRADRDRITALACGARIPLQIGTTHGSTDGTVFPPFGAAFVALSWPGRYSHTPAEVLDLRDLDSLARLIGLLALR